jgi:hypothetical protein
MGGVTVRVELNGSGLGRLTARGRREIERTLLLRRSVTESKKLRIGLFCRHLPVRPQRQTLDISTNSPKSS